MLYVILVSKVENYVFVVVIQRVSCSDKKAARQSLRMSRFDLVRDPLWVFGFQLL